MKGVGLIYAIFPLAAGIVLAQRWREAAPGGDDYYTEFETCRTAREVPWHSTPPPNWTNQVGFEKDAFTFARMDEKRAYPLGINIIFYVMTH
ncbi:MAG: hypothetical protein DME18_03090 [Verrucomicrobia bacterium]|nr:MAG: hypothetical protein DME18_03090 [Verrucomicrobiota bacterium]